MKEVVYHSHLHGCLFNIFISLFLNKCCCVDQQYEACVPRNCGDLSISFPFFIAGVQQPYCGSPGYNITCVNNTDSFLQIPEYNQNLLVDEIFYDNRSLRVSNGALRSNAESCGTIRQIARNLTVRSDHFEYIDDSRLVLLWSCDSTDAKLERYKVICNSISFLVMKGNDPNLASVACTMRAEAPVIDDDQIVTSSNFYIMMRRGFVLKWRATDCRECKSTNGRCGVDIERDQFLCFCPDRPHYTNCTETMNTGLNQQRKKNSSTVRGIIIATSVIFAVALLCSITCISYRRVVAKGKDQNIKENQTPWLYDNEYLMDRGHQFGEDDKKDINVPFFELEIILAATDNFSQAHKLGQGGFGPVYKGKFPGGEEIAVKRLSSNSGQGLEEFKNEVVLIAKLQHQNLVRLLGYSIKGNERILLYEYMPNKSLDVFIFDEKLRMLLNWATRFDIIAGVARGLLYLHQDSRLRIIHRDMKASNILLDVEMNPKISDFGLARIVGRKETEFNTTRVMGTYGYMAPEYAVEGQFSVKSDAFSFGVVVLEIISGKKNTGFFNSQLALSLLGYGWSLWEEGKPMTLLDETLVGACNTKEVLKCIVVGLLCVQEDPNDRPNMSKVVTMLSSETETIPNPKQPAFVTRKRYNGRTSSSSTKPETQSKNEITLSELDGR